MKKNNIKPKIKTITVDLPISLIELLDKESAKESCSRTYLIKYILEERYSAEFLKAKESFNKTIADLLKGVV